MSTIYLTVSCDSNVARPSSLIRSGLTHVLTIILSIVFLLIGLVVIPLCVWRLLVLRRRRHGLKGTSSRDLESLPAYSPPMQQVPSILVLEPHLDIPSSTRTQADPHIAKRPHRAPLDSSPTHLSVVTANSSNQNEHNGTSPVSLVLPNPHGVSPVSTVRTLPNPFSPAESRESSEITAGPFTPGYSVMGQASPSSPAFSTQTPLPSKKSKKEKGGLREESSPNPFMSAQEEKAALQAMDDPTLHYDASSSPPQIAEERKASVAAQAATADLSTDELVEILNARLQAGPSTPRRNGTLPQYHP
jgi:hypothetical protein